MSYKAIAVHAGEYDSLEHHGIKGMRWGVRRYQNQDGSLTSAGKQRYQGPGSQKKTSGSAIRSGSGSKASTSSGNGINSKSSQTSGLRSSFSKPAKAAAHGRMEVLHDSSKPIDKTYEILERDANQSGKTVDHSSYDNSRKAYTDRLKELAASGGDKAVDRYLMQEGYTAYQAAGDAYAAYVYAYADPGISDEKKEQLLQEAMAANDRAAALRDAAAGQRKGYEQYLPSEHAMGGNQTRDPKWAAGKESANDKSKRRKQTPKGDFTGYG